jgi:hypothetical protein
MRPQHPLAHLPALNRALQLDALKPGHLAQKPATESVKPRWKALAKHHGSSIASWHVFENKKN